MVLKVSITKEQADVLVKTATGLSMVTLRTMNVQDLIRFWIDQGCPLYGDPGFPAKSPKPAGADSAAAPVVAGSDAVGRIEKIVNVAAQNWKDKHQGNPEKKPSPNQPAADANAGAAPARLPIEKPKGGIS